MLWSIVLVKPGVVSTDLNGWCIAFRSNAMGILLSITPIVDVVTVCTLMVHINHILVGKLLSILYSSQIPLISLVLLFWDSSINVRIHWSIVQVSKGRVIHGHFEAGLDAIEPFYTLVLRCIHWCMCSKLLCPWCNYLSHLVLFY